MSEIDPANFALWFEAHAARMVLYARQWLGAAEADDAVQEAFVRLMRQRTAPRSVPAWLFTVVRHVAMDRRRSEARRRSREQRIAIDETFWFEPDVLAPLNAAMAQEAVASLPSDLREIIILRIWGELSFPQIAQVVGVAVSTVHVHYKAGLAGIRQRMESSCNPTTRRTN